jgi:polar amino acid transport system substrate-binding protein
MAEIRPDPEIRLISLIIIVSDRTGHTMNFRRNLISLALLTALTMTQATGAEVLKITANIWPPYVDDQMSGNGVAIALVTAALERAGYTPELTIEPWPEALDATRDGRYDVVCSLWLTDERAAELAFSEPYLQNHLKLIKRANSNIQYFDRDDLVGLTIGTVSDYAYSAQPYDTSGIEVTESGSVRDNIQSLLANEIDLVLADSRVAFYEVDELRAAKQITVLPKPVNSRGLRIAVSKSRADHAEIIAAFDQAVAAMKEDGSYNSLMANYRISE